MELMIVLALATTHSGAVACTASATPTERSSTVMPCVTATPNHPPHVALEAFCMVHSRDVQSFCAAGTSARSKSSSRHCSVAHDLWTGVAYAGRASKVGTRAGSSVKLSKPHCHYLLHKPQLTKNRCQSNATHSPKRQSAILRLEGAGRRVARDGSSQRAQYARVREPDDRARIKRCRGALRVEVGSLRKSCRLLGHRPYRCVVHDAE